MVVLQDHTVLEIHEYIKNILNNLKSPEHVHFRFPLKKQKLD